MEREEEAGGVGGAAVGAGGGDPVDERVGEGFRVAEVRVEPPEFFGVCVEDGADFFGFVVGHGGVDVAHAVSVGLFRYAGCGFPWRAPTVDFEHPGVDVEVQFVDGAGGGVVNEFLPQRLLVDEVSAGLIRGLGHHLELADG